MDIEEDRRTRTQEVKQSGQRRQLVGLEHLLSPLEVVLNTLQTISRLTNTQERAFSERRLSLPSKKPLQGRRRRKFPLKVNKRPKQKARGQFGPLKARDPGEPAGGEISSILIGRHPTLLRSHWSRASQTVLKYFHCCYASNLMP